MNQYATFAAGCFWGIEEHFRTLAGVVSTQVGYIGGHTENPTYREVCNGDTEHAEAVQIEFDPEQVSFTALLQQFWQCHNPTEKDRQGVDVGRQYRSAIFVHDDAQYQTAKVSMQQAQADFSRPIATEIVPATIFYRAEEYHQLYIAKKRGLI